MPPATDGKEVFTSCALVEMPPKAVPAEVCLKAPTAGP